MATHSGKVAARLYMYLIQYALHQLAIPSTITYLLLPLCIAVSCCHPMPTWTSGAAN